MLIGALGSRAFGFLFFASSQQPFCSDFEQPYYTREKRLKDYECVFIFSPVQPKAIYCPLSNARNQNVKADVCVCMSELELNIIVK